MTTNSSAEASAPEQARTAATKPKRPLVMGVFFSVAALTGGVYYASRRGIEATDDAQIEAEVVSVPTRAAGIVAKVSFT